MAKHRILIVEDDDEIRQLVERYLRENDFETTSLSSAEGLDQALTGPVDLIVLDLNLPGEDGLSVCRRIRAASRIPIIMATARGEEIDRIIGLEMGADDYVAKPFNPRELLARIRAVLRRGESPQHGEGGTFAFADYVLDPSLRELKDRDGARVSVTGAEFDLLHAFCERPGRVLSRDQLLDLTHGNVGGPFERSIDVLVSRLRQKIEADAKGPQIIKTVRSGGYQFAAKVVRR